MVITHIVSKKKNLVITSLLLLMLLFQNTNYMSVSAYQLDMDYLDLENQTHEFKEFAGTPLFVEAFAPWCSVCKEEHPVIDLLWRTYNDSINFLSLSIYKDDGINKIKDYLKDYPMSWYVGWDNDEEFKNKFNIKGTPTMFLFNEDGLLLQCWKGKTEFEDIARELNAYLENPKEYERTANPTCETPLYKSWWLYLGLFAVLAGTSTVLYYLYKKNLLGSSKNT